MVLWMVGRLGSVGLNRSSGVGFCRDQTRKVCGDERSGNVSVLKIPSSDASTLNLPRSPPSLDAACAVVSYGFPLWVHTEECATSPGRQECPRQLQASWVWKGQQGSPMGVHRLWNWVSSGAQGQGGPAHTDVTSSQALKCGPASPLGKQ